MSTATAARPVTPNRRREVDRQPVNEQRRIRAEQARQFEVNQKNLIQRAALKVRGFFKKVVTKAKALVVAARPALSRAVKHWPVALAGALYVGAVVIAPATTLVATTFIIASYAIARVDSPFARFVAHVFFRAGVETFAEGLAFAVIIRNRR
jgi:hypothetical protein